VIALGGFKKPFPEFWNSLGRGKKGGFSTGLNDSMYPPTLLNQSFRGLADERLKSGLRRRLRILSIRTRCHGNHDIFPLLAVGFGHSKEHLVFVQSKFCRLANG